MTVRDKKERSLLCDHLGRQTDLTAHCGFLWVAIATMSVVSLVHGAHRVARPVPGPGGRHAGETGPAGRLASGSKLVVDKTIHDFGRIRCGSIHTAAFRLTNAGTSPLRIINVQGCCGVVTELDKSELAPNQSAVLRAEYRAPYAPGTIRKKIQVEIAKT